MKKTLRITFLLAAMTLAGFAQPTITNRYGPVQIIKTNYALAYPTNVAFFTSNGITSFSYSTLLANSTVGEWQADLGISTNSGGSYTNMHVSGVEFLSGYNITNSNATASRVAVYDAAKRLTNSPNVDLTEIEYLDGATANIQTNINARLAATNGTSSRLTISGTTTNSGTLSGGVISGATSITINGTASGSLLTINTNILIVTNSNVGIGTGPGSEYKVDVLGSASVVPAHFKRPHTTTTAKLDILELHAVSTGDMSDGFGAEQRFYIEDSAAVANLIGSIQATRDGADTEGSIRFLAGTSGIEEFLTIKSSGQINTAGNIGLGVTALGTSAAKSLGIGGSTKWSTQPANMVQVGSFDRGGTAGKAALHIQSEDGTWVVLGDQTIVNATNDLGGSRFFVNGRSATITTTTDADLALSSSHSTVFVNTDAKLITLPAAATSDNALYTVKFTTTGSCVLTNSGGNIETASSFTITNYQAVTVQSDGTNWWVIGKY